MYIFLFILDDHLSKMNDGKHVYGANCIKGMLWWKCYSSLEGTVKIGYREVQGTNGVTSLYRISNS